MSSSRYVLTIEDMKPVDRDAGLVVEVFHLEGQHDQSTHGRRGADSFDVMTKTYNTTFDAPDGSRYEIRADIEMTNRDRWTKAKGTIHDENGVVVGKFLRLVDNESGRVDNVHLNIHPDHQARGIGVAFLDQTEAALEAELDVSYYSVGAQEVGKYAWASRGYRLAKFGGGTESHGIRTRELWSQGARERYGSLTPDQQQRSEAVLAGWAESGDNVYPADLLAISPEFKDVFLRGPEWLGYREVKRGSTQGLSLAHFHLQGQHDQQTHAGGRGSKAGIQLNPDASWMAPFHERVVIDGKTHLDVSMEKWREMVKHQGAIDAAAALPIETQDAIITELESDGLKNALAARDVALLGFGESLLEGVDPETSMKVPLPLTLQLSHLQAAAAAGVTESSVFEDARFAELADAIQDSDASWESTQDMSIYIEETWGVTPVTGVFHAFNKGWQESSRSAPSLAVQAVVAERFAIDTADFDEFVDVSSRLQQSQGEYIGRRLPRTVEGFVEGTYNRTQEFLAETRAQEIGLYRGVRGDTYKPTAGTEITGNPISSWTQAEPVAWQFATGSNSGTGRVLTDYAARSDVFSIAAVTGMGAVHEHEVILLGTPQILDEVEEIS